MNFEILDKQKLYIVLLRIFGKKLLKFSANLLTDEIDLDRF